MFHLYLYESHFNFLKIILFNNSQWTLVSFRKLLKCYLLVEAFFDYAIENKNLCTCSAFPSPLSLLFPPLLITIVILFWFVYLFFYPHQSVSSMRLGTFQCLEQYLACNVGSINTPEWMNEFTNIMHPAAQGLITLCTATFIAPYLELGCLLEGSVLITGTLCFLLSTLSDLFWAR